MLIIGIDPGFTGAVACYNPRSGDITVSDMPVTKDKKNRTILDHPGVLALFEGCQHYHVMAVLEFVAARQNQSAPATFRFGQGYGALEMALAANKIPVQYATPAKWKGYFGLSSDKGVSRAYATQRFPHAASFFSRVKDDGRAEASLLALYGAEVLSKHIHP